MPDFLNERMAAALAPAVGEAAVYVESPGFLIGDRNHPSVHYAAMVPVNFADPAVGWGLWERWHALPENETCEMVVARNIRHHFLVRLIFPEASGRRLGYGYADKVLSALLAAWAQVLEVEEVSGDA